jgi:hypothetical protein
MDLSSLNPPVNLARTRARQCHCFFERYHPYLFAALLAPGFNPTA